MRESTSCDALAYASISNSNAATVVIFTLEAIVGISWYLKPYKYYTLDKENSVVYYIPYSLYRSLVRPSATISGSNVTIVATFTLEALVGISRYFKA